MLPSGDSSGGFAATFEGDVWGALHQHCVFSVSTEGLMAGWYRCVQVPHSHIYFTQTNVSLFKGNNTHQSTNRCYFFFLDLTHKVMWTRKSVDNRKIRGCEVALIS